MAKTDYRQDKPVQNIMSSAADVSACLDMAEKKAMVGNGYGRMSLKSGCARCLAWLDVTAIVYSQLFQTVTMPIC